METLDQTTNTKRPDFLTVLCILTFISVAWHVFSGLSSIATAGSEEALEEAQYQMEQAMQGGEVPGFMQAFLGGAVESAVLAAENAMALGLGETILFLIIGVGAFLMWKQEKKGFYIYTVANIAWVLYNPIVLGFNQFALYGAIVVFIFVALFIGLYSANLKHMH